MAPGRPRAPTITIDTTDVNSDTPDNATQDGAGAGAIRPVTHSPTITLDDGTSPTTVVDPLSQSWSYVQRTTQESSDGPDSRTVLSTEASFENEKGRPTSPHNISSPIARTDNFLSVPGNDPNRSRENSVDSTDGSRPRTSMQTTDMGATTLYQSEAGDAKGLSAELDSVKIMNSTDALKPDQGTEAAFQVDNNPFAFSPGQLSKMFNPKSLAAFYKLGGLKGIEKGLRADRHAGLGIDESRLDGHVSFEEATGSNKLETEGADSTPLRSTSTGTNTQGHKPEDRFADRKRVYKDNILPEKKGKSLLQLMWITYNDKVLILLSIAAVVSLAIGLYQTFGTYHAPGTAPVEWVEGVAIIVAILIVVIVGSLNDFQKERQFAKLNKKKQSRDVKIVRSGKTVELSVFEILVGDVIHLEPGDVIPVDGILIEGFNVKCDESQATGESDVIRKRPADEVIAAIENGDDLAKMDPFIQSGARVMEGVGTFMATAVGVNSTYGKTLMALNEDPEMTPLQSKLNVIAEYIAKLGGAAGLLLFIVLFIKFLANLKNQGSLTPAEKGQEFLNIFIVVVTIIVVAVPEGLPLAVTLALAFATTRMLKDNNLVRHLQACEVMGNATTICSDKTGTLTQNKMQVVAGTISTSHRFGGAPPRDGETAAETKSSDIGAAEFTKMLGADVKALLKDSITLNSTAFEGDVDGQMTFIGSKTESALLIFAKEFLAMGPVAEERANAKILQLIPFDSGRKCMGVVVQLPNGRARLYVKGASEIVLAQCTEMLRDPSSDCSTTSLGQEHKNTVTKLIEHYATQSLRTIGIVSKDFEQWPPAKARRVEGEKDEVQFDSIFKNMTFIAMVGIKDPLREGVREAVKDCQKAGVVIRMVTGDNKLTAQAIAADCGILQPDSIVMEGPEFRNMHSFQQKEILPRLHVLARSSPEDKRTLVGLLQNMGETVAVTGDGTNDAPALKLADVGFSMGIAGTEVAKEASAIILMDDNFASIVKALKWGRAVNDAVKRFLQFQLTVNITAVVLTFVSAVSSESESSVLTAVQLLWVNLIMDTLAALALATDPPQDSVLERKPERRNASMISTTMWKMIIGQAIYQLAITFMIYYGKEVVLPGPNGISDDQIQTLVFNTFVWMQIFNQWNNRRLDNKFNIFEGLFKNWFFIGISAIMCGGQVLIIFVGGRAFNIASPPQTGIMWGTAILLGFLSVPIGIVIRLIPDSLCEKLVPESLKRRANSKVPEFTISDEERFEHYPAPFTDVRDELTFMKKLKGGRINNLKFAMKHPRETFIAKYKSPSHSRSNSVNMPATPSRENSFSYNKNSPSPSNGGLATSVSPESKQQSRSVRSRSNSALGASMLMTGLVAGSIGAAGWSPVERQGDWQQFPPPQPGPSPLGSSAGGKDEDTQS